MWSVARNQRAEERHAMLPKAFLFAVLLLLLLVGLQRPPTGPVAAAPDGSLSLKENELTFTLYFPVTQVTGSVPLVADGPLYGVNFISSAEDLADEQQYQNGLATGAAWNRWPLYWPAIETAQGQYDWSTQDAAATADIANGLKINAILLGTPGFYTTSSVNPEQMAPAPAAPISINQIQAAAPQGLYEPIFSDGSDIPGAGKAINPGNVWARFVYAAVNRYKPGGSLAQAQNWPDGAGITHWEMWNEPDLSIFWDSSLPDYARLLKVGYLAAKQADPNAQVLFAGLANNFEWLSYYDEVLTIYDGDSLAATYNYFHDILATHSYFYAWQSWYHVYRARNTMLSYGLDKPIWLNESGVPAWDDYPGPTWDSQSPLRARTSEQADFIIQSAFYATYAGADAIFHFQLYDGCGNQPRYSDFPPHDGELCGTPDYPVCAGDANGLFRNPADAACFTQHPDPESPRPNFDAFRLLTTYFTDVIPLWRQRPGGDDPYNGPQEWIAFYRPESQQRILGLWSRVGEAQTAHVPAAAGTALLLTPDGTMQTISPVNGIYTLNLPGATNQNAFWDPNLRAIGGRPYILIEQASFANAMAAR